MSPRNGTGLSLTASFLAFVIPLYHTFLHESAVSASLNGRVAVPPEKRFLMSFINYLLNYSEKLATATLVAWPPVIIFFIFHKQFIEANMAGALKGG